MRNTVYHYVPQYVIPILTIMLFAPIAVVAEERSAGKGSIENRVERLEHLMGSEKQIELLHRVNQLQQENQQLRSLLEEQNHLLKTLKNQQRDRYMDLNQRLNQVERGGSQHSTPTTYKAAKDSAPPTLPAEKKPATVKKNTGVEIVDKSIQVHRGESKAPTKIQRESITVDSGVSDVQEKESVYIAKPMSAKERKAEQKAYQKAYDELRAQRYAKARDSFSEFIKLYPHGRYAHIAQYWIGESSYAQKAYPQAVQDYQQLIDFYPNSPKRAESQLKKAYSFYEMGDKANARKTLQQLLAQYPDTTEASQAKRLLKNL